MTVRTAAFPVIDGGKIRGGHGLDNPTRPPDPPDMEQRVAILEAGMGEIKGSLGRIEATLIRIDERLTKVEGTVDRMDERLTRVENTVDRMDERLRKVETEVARMDGRLSQVPTISQTIGVTIGLVGMIMAGLFAILKYGVPSH